MEFISEQAVAIWGPFAIVVIILIAGIIGIAKYFVNRQKHWDEMDQRRNEAFVQVTKEFNLTAKEFSNNATKMNDILVEVKGLVSSMNIGLIQLTAKQDL